MQNRAIQNQKENLSEQHFQIQISLKLVHFIHFCMILFVLLETILLYKYNNINILFRKANSVIFTGYHLSRLINSASPSISVLIFLRLFFKLPYFIFNLLYCRWQNRHQSPSPLLFLIHPKRPSNKSLIINYHNLYVIIRNIYLLYTYSREYLNLGI